MQIREQLSIWASIDSQKDAIKAAKSPCFPVPYTLVTVQKPVAGGKTGFIPCVELKNINGGEEVAHEAAGLKLT